MKRYGSFYQEMILPPGSISYVFENNIPFNYYLNLSVYVEHFFSKIPEVYGSFLNYDFEFIFLCELNFPVFVVLDKVSNKVKVYINLSIFIRCHPLITINLAQALAQIIWDQNQKIQNLYNFVLRHFNITVPNHNQEILGFSFSLFFVVKYFDYDNKSSIPVFGIFKELEKKLVN